MALLVRRALDLAFPATCAGCRAEGEPICTRCAPALDARLDLPPGTPLGLAADLPAPLLQVEWCAPFSGVVRRALHDLKYRGETRLAGPLGGSVARRWARAGRGGDLLVPVPVHDKRRRERGYDQAQLIADAAAAATAAAFAEVPAPAEEPEVRPEAQPETPLWEAPSWEQPAAVEEPGDADVFDGDALPAGQVVRGPAVVAHRFTTIVLRPGDAARVLPTGDTLVEVGASIAPS